MVASARVIGVYGAGKTTEAMCVMDKVLATEVCDPTRIGYVTFTRSARRIAAARAADKFGLSIREVENDGWFRTLHSVAYRCLGVDKAQVINGSKADIEWLQNAIQQRVRVAGEENGDSFQMVADDDPVSQCLAAWDTARNRLQPFDQVWRERAEQDSRFPTLDHCAEIIRHYEEAKLKDDRCDFADMLLRFAGWNMTLGGPTRVVPEGNAPSLSVWFHDEAQDASRLTTEVFKRLVLPASYCYIFLDPLQAIYSWAGSDPSFFMGWPCQKERTLYKTHRCAAEIVDIAERMMADSPGWQTRPVIPARSGGKVTSVASVHDAVGELVEGMGSNFDELQGKSVLALARTNQMARELEDAVDRLHVPWKPIKRRGGYDAPKRIQGILALYRLQSGGEVDGKDWAAVLELVPKAADGTQLLVHGIKKYFESDDNCDRLHPVPLTVLEDVGATTALKNMIGSGDWKKLDAQFAKVAEAATRFGTEAVKHPRVQVGTIHASKGLEADHVLLWSRIPVPTQRMLSSGENETQIDEERRVWHVGCSRAKERLTVVHDGRSGFRNFDSLKLKGA